MIWRWAVVLWLVAVRIGSAADCNQNEIPDRDDIQSGTSADCNGNGVLDLCDIDLSTSADCNRDRIPDECPTFHASWTSRDADDDGILDHCDEDNPYELRFVGPTNLRSAVGVATADFFVEIVDGAAASAIQGFSYGVRAEGCTITRATVEGTALFGLPLYLAGFRGGAERPYLPPVECIWSYSGVALDGATEAHRVLRLTVSCPRAEGSPCSSGVLDFSPTCFYTGEANCWIELEDGYRLPLLTPRPFTICLGDFRRGDANADRKVDISDGIRMAMYLFLGAPPPPCLDAADATDDGAHDISDAIRILMDFFIPQDTNIPAPGPFECGPDPSPDDFGCDAPAEC